MRLFGPFAASVIAALLPASALAQRQPASPEQRIDRLERQVQQMQRQVYPRGRPADTAGFSNEPAATQSSVVSLDQRLDALERQMADIVRISEENGHRLQSLAADIANARTDQEQRLSALEQRINEAAVRPVPSSGLETTTPVKPPAAKPATKPPSASLSTNAPPAAMATPEGDPGEDAYTEGYRQWEAGNYDGAISTLRAFTSAYPKHRRLSYANNLIGRALLDKGDPRSAAEALLRNYRSNPQGERAADSLYYLGQALMKLGQPGQACKAYAELEAVYPKARPELKNQVQEGKTQAQCG